MDQSHHDRSLNKKYIYPTLEPPRGGGDFAPPLDLFLYTPLNYFHLIEPNINKENTLNFTKIDPLK